MEGIASLFLLLSCSAPLHGDEALQRAAAETMIKATRYFRGQVTRREGEGTASPTTIWVQPPGTPSVGMAFLRACEDARGTQVVQDLLAAAEMGGGHVEHYWDDPEQEGDEETAKTAYATSYLSGVTNTTVVLIGGYYEDASEAAAATFDPSIIPPRRLRPPT